MRAAQAEAKKEVEEYKAVRESKLRTVQPEVRAPPLYMLRRRRSSAAAAAADALPARAAALPLPAPPRRRRRCS